MVWFWGQDFVKIGLVRVFVQSCCGCGQHRRHRVLLGGDQEEGSRADDCRGRMGRRGQRGAAVGAGRRDVQRELLSLRVALDDWRKQLHDRAGPGAPGFAPGGWISERAPRWVTADVRQVPMRRSGSTYSGSQSRGLLEDIFLVRIFLVLACVIMAWCFPPCLSAGQRRPVCLLR